MGTVGVAGNAGSACEGLCFFGAEADLEWDATRGGRRALTLGIRPCYGKGTI
jgi:hypothetical protein